MNLIVHPHFANYVLKSYLIGFESIPIRRAQIHTTTPWRLVKKFLMEIHYNTLSDPRIEPRTSYSEVTLATRPPRLSSTYKDIKGHKMVAFHDMSRIIQLTTTYIG